MSLHFRALVIEEDDPAAAASFWAGLLGRDPVPERDGILLPGTTTQVGLRFVPSTTPTRGTSWLHLHVTSDDPDHQHALVDAAEQLGGRRRGTGPLPWGRVLYLSDAGGDDLCVIAPGNAYLAGCGPLGEITSNGPRSVGLFWRDALGWELVWDEGDETAIQSPVGGTKIAWDVWPTPVGTGPFRQRFELDADDPDAETARLVALGAEDLGSAGDERVLADPGGIEFRLLRRAPAPRT